MGMQFNKKMNRSGGITLPSAMRREYGLESGEKFNIIVDSEDGTILLQRTQGQCMFCKNDKNMIVFQGRFICAKCVDLMSADVADRQLANAFEGRVAE